MELFIGNDLVDLVRLPSVAEFVEGVSALLHLGTGKNERLTLARSFSTMQNRYALLDSANMSPLLSAIAGRSIYQDESPSSFNVEIIQSNFERMQQLVSWIRSSFVFRCDKQQDLHMDILKNFASPQLTILWRGAHENLPTYSPLKQMDLCVESLVLNEFDPIIACKAIIKDILQNALYDKPIANLNFYKSLNALDNRSTKHPATQRQELMSLDTELKTRLNDEDRREIINVITGIYSCMMIFKRLSKLMGKWGEGYFQIFISTILSDLTSLNFDERLKLNLDLTRGLYSSPEQLIGYNPVTSRAFKKILNLTMCLSEPSPSPLTKFFKVGITRTSTESEILKLQNDMSELLSEQYSPVACSFLNGVSSIISNHKDIALERFTTCIELSQHWPAGILERQSIMFKIGLLLNLNPAMPPNTINPLLSLHILATPQEVSMRLDDSADSTLLAIQNIILEYNHFCCLLCETPETYLVNPLRRIEDHLLGIFTALRDEDLDETPENIRSVSKRLTGKRERQRIKSDFLGTSLYDWLVTRNMAEVLLYFYHPKSLKLIPYICRYLSLSEENQDEIIASAAPLK
jgi:hypothetical protein